jgi:hypothetical protein
MCSYLHSDDADIHVLMVLRNTISLFAKNKVNLHISFEVKVAVLTLHLVVDRKELIFNDLKNVSDKICANWSYKHYI